MSQATTVDDKPDEDELNWYEQLQSEGESMTVTHSDTDAIYVETDSFSGRHSIWYSKYQGPRLSKRGLYDLPDGNQIECIPEWIDVIYDHFEQHYGGSQFDGEQ